MIDKLTVDDIFNQNKHNWEIHCKLSRLAVEWVVAKYGHCNCPYINVSKTFEVYYHSERIPLEELLK